MLFVIYAEDIENSLAKRKLHSIEHRQRLHQLKDEGRLVIAGPCPLVEQQQSHDAGFSGSVIIAEFSSLETAQKWADSDPFLLNGIYASVIVKPFIQFLP